MTLLRSISLSWFRGASEKALFKIPKQSVVAYGDNGAGKSSFVDGIECLISGKCEHLSHEYSGTNQEKGLINTHKPADATSCAEVQFDDGTAVKGRFGKSKPVIEGTAKETVQSWSYRRTILRQDEIAAFIKSSKGDKYSALLPLLGLGHLEHAAENVRQLSKAVADRGGLKIKTGQLSAAIEARHAAFGEKTDAEIDAVVEGIYKRYVDAGETNPAAQRKVADQEIASKQADFSKEERRYNALKKLADFKLDAHVQRLRDANACLAELSEPLVQERLAVVNAARAFATDLAGEVECPACGTLVTADDFREHLEAETERLKEIQISQEDRRSALSAFCDEVLRLRQLWDSAELEDWRGAEAQQDLVRRSVVLRDLDLAALRQACSEENLEQISGIASEISAAADRDSFEAPASVQALYEHARVLEAAEKSWSLKDLKREIGRLETAVAFLDTLEDQIRSEIRSASKAVFNAISKDIQGLWDQFHPDKRIQEVRLHVPFDADKAIDIGILFHGVEQLSPRLTLSEGYRNSLGLCIFLALAKREPGSVPIILDDVVISLDRDHRGMLSEILEAEFSDRQIILLTHDREWYVELSHLLSGPRWTFEMLMPWSDPETGIRFQGTSSNFDVARSHLETRPDSAGNDARKTMDTELPIIAEKLRTRLPFRRGMKNDQRTGIDFISQLIGDAGKAFELRTPGGEYGKHQAAVEALDRAKRRMIAWGNPASHTFETKKAEASKLIAACEGAIATFKCGSCDKPVWSADTGNSEILQCQCGQIRWRYGKT